MGIDARIASSLADRQVELFRFDAGISNYAIREFKQLEKTVKVVINSYSSVLNNRQSSAIKKEIKSLIHSTYHNISQYTYEEVNGLPNHEAEVTAAILSASVGKRYNPVKITIEPNINGIPLSEYWRQEEGATTLKVVSSVQRGVIDGAESSEIATASALAIASRVNSLKSLIKTGTQAVVGEARMRVFETNTATLGYIHTSILDGKTSIICLVRANSVWGLNKEPILGTTERFANPPLHPNCRSFLRIYIGEPIESVSGEDWLMSKTVGEQDGLLGKGRADLWRREVITWADLLNQQGRPLTLSELKKLH